MVQIPHPHQKIEQKRVQKRGKTETAVLVPITHNDEILFIEGKSTTIQLPTLRLSNQIVAKSKSPENYMAANPHKRTGINPEILTFLGTLPTSIKYSKQQYHVYLAHDLVPVDLDNRDTSTKLRKVHLNQINNWVKSRKLNDRLSIATLYLIRLYLKQHYPGLL